MFKQAKRTISQQSEQGGGNRSGENQAVINGSNAAKNQLAQSACAHGRSNGGDTDASNRSRSKAGKND